MALHLGSKTNWTLIKDRLGQVELGNASGKEMGAGKFVIRTMAKTLVPEQAFSLGREAVEGQLMCGGVVRMVLGI